MVKVLIVDDEKDFCDSLKELLSQEGYEAICAYSGQEALEKIKGEHPQLILLDILMPEMDGIQTLKEIKSIDKGAIVIVISAVREKFAQERMLHLGAVSYMFKPLDLDLFKRNIEVWAAQIELNRISSVSMVAFQFDETKIKTIVELFAKKGYNIKIIKSFQDSSELADTSVNFLILRADVLKTDTPKVINQIRTKYPTLPLIITTESKLEEELKLKINEIGACQYLPTSFDANSLLAIICSMLSKASKGQKLEIKEEKPCILIVDDEPDTCEYIEKFLSQEGYRSYSISQPKEVLKEIEKINPNLVLLDIVMPGTDGLEILGQIKKNFPNIRVVMLSGVKDEFILKQAIQSGASDYLVKPFSLDQLKITVLLNSLKSSHN
ncbi:MAG: response regulator [Candidatus Omnitrophota bacterium]